MNEDHHHTSYEDWLEKHISICNRIFQRMHRENSWPWVTDPAKWHIDRAMIKVREDWDFHEKRQFADPRVLRKLDQPEAWYS